jgi:hypothetical protein
MTEEPVVHLSVPLLLRLLEYSREDANSDLDLHFVVENILKHSCVLDMNHYKELVGEV